MIKRTILASTLALSVAACGGSHETVNATVDPYASRTGSNPALERQRLLQEEAAKATYKVIEGMWTFDYTGSQSALIMKEGLSNAGFDVVDVKTHGVTRYMMARHPLTEIYGNIRVGLTYRVRPATIDVKLSMRGPADFSPELADRLAGEIREGIVAQIEGQALPVRSHSGY